jgi:predicted Zn-dependent protease
MSATNGLMKKISFSIVINFVIFLLLSLMASDTAKAEAQTRKLPKASFPVLARPNSPLDNGSAAGTLNGTTQSDSSLPSSAGLHLTEGLDRKKGAPIEPYNPGEPDRSMARVRWEKKSMPLLIWISPGLKLPDCSMAELKNTRVDYVTQLLQTADPFIGMGQAPAWTPQMNDQVATGIEQWRQFENEGLFSFAFTDNPRNAHICVFFTDTFKDGNAPGGIAIGGNTCAQIYPVSLAHSMNIRQKPVIIELSTLVNSSAQKMIGAAAHEFGHALGIKAHSPYRDDLMYEDRVVDALSEADKATIRWLYHQEPQFVM